MLYPFFSITNHILYIQFVFSVKYFDYEKFTIYITNNDIK